MKKLPNRFFFVAMNIVIRIDNTDTRCFVQKRLNEMVPTSKFENSQFLIYYSFVGRFATVSILSAMQILTLSQHVKNCHIKSGDKTIKLKRLFMFFFFAFFSETAK